MSAGGDMDPALGIEGDYVDALGRTRAPPPDTVAFLRGVLERSAAEDARIPRVLVRHCDPARGHLSIPGACSWAIVAADGRREEGEGSAAGPAELEAGTYDLEVLLGDGTKASTILHLAPARAHMPEEMGERGRAWGIAVQLYSLRSERNWGIGDFGDLRVLIDRAAAAGAALVGLNPLHALFWSRPERCSPYAPSSRLFLNPLYLDVERCDAYARSTAARDHVADPAFARRLAKLRQRPLVDYPGVAAAKREVLEMLFAEVRVAHARDPDGPEARAFATYRAGGGLALSLFASFEVLSEVHGPDPGGWPEELRDPLTRAVSDFAASHEERIAFHCWLQWQADKQLGECQALARSRGMSIGVYRDLAVGSAADGAECWVEGELFVRGASVGAPPDLWNRMGQDWGLPPWNPRHLVSRAYAPLVALLAANMRHAGALRIDHALGLMRQFWVPAGKDPAQGAYVRFPFEDLLGIVALESVRQRCVVVGEDLGTVPPGFSEVLMQRGMLSYRVILFERDREGRAAGPGDYPLGALVVAGTHDLPTLPGFLAGTDLAAKRAAGAYPDEAAAKAEAEERPRERRLLLDRLRQEGLIGAGEPSPDAVVVAAYRLLARSAARLVMVQLEDILGIVEQANLPGTVDEHPNWRRKLPTTLDAIFADPRMAELAAALAAERPSRRP